MLEPPRARTTALPPGGALWPPRGSSPACSSFCLPPPGPRTPDWRTRHQGQPRSSRPSTIRPPSRASGIHPPLPALATNSLQPQDETATSIVADLFAGLRLWQGGEGYLQPEIAGGRGLSSTLGVASFPSGEVYLWGSPTPSIVVGRAFLRQTLGSAVGTRTRRGWSEPASRHAGPGHPHAHRGQGCDHRFHRQCSHFRRLPFELHGLGAFGLGLRVRLPCRHARLHLRASPPTCPLTGGRCGLECSSSRSRPTRCSWTGTFPGRAAWRVRERGVTPSESGQAPCARSCS